MNLAQKLPKIEQLVSNNDMGLEMGTLDGHGSRYTYLVFISLPVLFDSSTLSPEEMKEERNTVRERERSEIYLLV